MRRTYKFRAYPSMEQKGRLNRQMYLSKQLYNPLLEQSQKHFRETGKTFTKYDMNKWVQDISSNESIFYCQNCGMSKDRDLNASINILKRATEGQSESNTSGDVVRPQLREAVADGSGTIHGVSR